mmetsp:Transcript_21728/g.44149  ORF Transcript_21728/g.44149 Transcript_21728/m.44149 type:complete len:102 (+) Transcript_21728:225-530(+)|eukprot:CAMPEP_0202849742 /NCGR_PEP_ID=MMETSP1389-20130828/81641_1 /ASSEMBLY_ACC=CAM_ASM_000865 /TAXON_ID=302021 /ORGANISM="Rhodomonas sp., Strain CCMP768" /LENGTH=101 /DNA_ID=CAMNT_0049527821 /DNA_START=124 /DNA_END=429 /DNA_ORIENTATION=+
MVSSDPSDPLAMPAASCGAELSMGLQQALDRPINYLLGAANPPLVAQVSNQAFVGVNTGTSPRVGLASSVFFRDGSLPFAGVRLRVSKDLQGRVRFSSGLF